MRKIKRLILALGLLAGFELQAQTITNIYTQFIGGDIPMANPNGTNSTITVSGISGNIQSIVVSLNITNGFNGDLYAYLDDPSGNFAVLLNRVGVDGSDPFGYGDSGFNVTFSLDSANDIHFYQTTNYVLNTGGQLTGDWAADGRNIDPATNSFILASTPPTATLDSFVNANPNGDWTLFIADMSNVYQANWVGWELQIITPVPEPATTSLFGIGAAALLIFLRKNRKRPTS